MVLRLSHSQVALFQECQRKYKYSYLNKIQPRKEPIYFIFGKAMHAFIEAWHQKLPRPELALENVFKEVDTGILSQSEIHELERTKATVRGIARAYARNYKDDFNLYQQFICEREFRFPLVDGADYYGKLDVLMQDAAGDWWIKETKNWSFLDDKFLDRVKVDWQITGYMHGAKHILGVFPRGVVYDVVLKTQIRQKAGESLMAFCKRIEDEYIRNPRKKEYFTRHEVFIDGRQLKSWRREMEHVASSLVAKRREKSKVWPMTSGACIGKFSVCPFLEVCVTGKVNRLLFKRKDQ